MDWIHLMEKEERKADLPQILIRLDELRGIGCWVNFITEMAKHSQFFTVSRAVTVGRPAALVARIKQRTSVFLHVIQ